ncbi:MAG: Cysteine desulfurase SufS [Alphaproteobacteria bacterium MarineAlpha5_Bin2]|nr:MAG: Cysteine desulfurase SufS [Alphaproteobacteria bacterium MarineAlpha5_Bin2]
MFEDIRKKFPVYEKNPDLIFLDTAASALKPYDMIDAINNCYSYEYANVHRGLYSLSSKLTKKFEDVRVKVSNFISSKSYENIIFTKSATEGINLVVEKFSEKYLSEGDEVIISYLEHHANIVPWHMAAQKYKFKVIPIELTNNSEIDYADFKNKITSRTKFISLTHISNVTGSLTDFDIVKGIIKNLNIPLMIDGCQFVAHSELNVTDLDCDFYVFSGHKLYGPSGIGVLYMKERWFDDLDPYQGGGSMIDNVDIQQTDYAKGFQKFEAGTPPIAEVIGLNASIEFVTSLNLKKIFIHEKELHDYTLDKLKNINNLNVYGNGLNKGAIISFNISDIHANDLAMILDQKNVAIRTGHHCAQPLMKYLNITFSARASFGVYNNKNDVDLFVNSLVEAKKFLT